MSEFFTVLWNFVCGMGLLGMIGIVIVIYCALDQGLVLAAVGFASIFFLICFFGWNEFFGEEFMAKFMIAVGTGLLIAFFVWQVRD